MKKEFVERSDNKSLLLHICCGPCAASPIEQLQADYKVDLVFYGPNIHPETEYQKRLAAARELSKKLDIDLIELPYESDIWFEQLSLYKDEPEGGQRCAFCHKLRLERVARFAKSKKIPFYATTLTISPHKPANIINNIGIQIANDNGLAFLEADYKKNNGFQKSCQISKQLGLYRQNYCGCLYSMKKKSEFRNQKSEKKEQRSI